MSRTALHTMIHRLALATATPDADLLRRFAVDRDETAFTVLVSRHAPMVLDVCRSVLGNHADAEDALQATFLVLARKAASVRTPGSLAAWLHAVAYRIARKARARTSRRRAHEARAPGREAATADDLTWNEVREALHAALATLRERYRAPLVLCYLRGMTQDQAAHALGLSRAALKKRLERGRAQLRIALDRRGLGPTALLAVTALPAPPPLPPALAAATARTATLAVAGPAHAAAIPAAVLWLAREGSQAMLTTKVMLPLLAVVLGLVLLGGPGYPAPEGGAPAIGVPAKPGPAKQLQKPAHRDNRELAGVWQVRHVETSGTPLLAPNQLAKARLTFRDRRATVANLPVPLLRDFAFRLDPSRNPKEIDVTFLAGPLEDQTFQGIYIIRKDEARVCLRLKRPEMGRPRGFVTISGDTLYTLILERVEAKDASADPRWDPKLFDGAAMFDSTSTFRDYLHRGDGVVVGKLKRWDGETGTVQIEKTLHGKLDGAEVGFTRDGGIVTARAGDRILVLLKRTGSAYRLHSFCGATGLYRHSANLQKLVEHLLEGK